MATPQRFQRCTCRKLATSYLGRNTDGNVQQQREMKLSDIHAAAASRAGSRANSLNRGPMNGAINPGAATGIDAAHAQGPVAPGAAGAGGPDLDRDSM